MKNGKGCKTFCCLAMAYGGYGAQKDGIDDSALPAEMLIDYVRFYELKEHK